MAQTWHPRFGEFIHKRDNLCSSTAKASVDCSSLNILSDAAYQYSGGVWFLVTLSSQPSYSPFEIELWNHIVRRKQIRGQYATSDFGILWYGILVSTCFSMVCTKSENCCTEVPGVTRLFRLLPSSTSPRCVRFASDSLEEIGTLSCRVASTLVHSECRGSGSEVGSGSVRHWIAFVTLYSNWMQWGTWFSRRKRLTSGKVLNHNYQNFKHVWRRAPGIVDYPALQGASLARV